MKAHVVKYPGSIEKALLTMEDMKKYRAHSIVSKAGLPEGTLFDAVGVMNEEEFGHTSFTILLPSGEAFTGFAVKRHGDNNDPDAANCIAAGRAVAVWRHQKEVKDKMEFRQSFLPGILSFRVEPVTGTPLSSHKTSTSFEDTGKITLT